MKRFLLVQFVLSMICLMFLFSCSETNFISNESIDDMSYGIYNYTDDEIDEIHSFAGNYDDLISRYPKGLFIKTERKACYYGKNKALIVSFDDSMNKVINAEWQLSLTRSEFEKIQVGESYSEVMKMDPGGNYMAFYMGLQLPIKESYHFTKDGYICTISYDDNGSVTTMDFTSMLEIYNEG